MYKFLNSNEWLSIEDAIDPLGAILGGGCKCSDDVLALLFDGKLQGSIHSSGVCAVPLAEMTDDEAKTHRGTKWKKPNGQYIATISLDDCVMLRATNPVLDVPFFCKRVGDIDFFLDAKERRLDISRNIRVPPGTLVKTPDKDDYFCVLGGSSIPETFGQIVIRTQAIQKFQRQQIELKVAPAKDTATPVPVAVAALVEPTKAITEKPMQRAAAQDAAILCEIQKQGLDPLALPKNPAGKRGPKAAIRAALSSNPLFAGGTIFDKAWERLTNNADIVIQG